MHLVYHDARTSRLRKKVAIFSERSMGGEGLT